MEEIRNVQIPGEGGFTRRDALALGLGLGLSALFWSVFSMEATHYLAVLPGLGATLLVLAVLLAAALYLGKNIRITAESVFLTAAAVCLAATLTLFGNVFLRFLNYFLCALLSAMAVYALAGTARRRWWEPQVLLDTVGFSFAAAFRNWGVPFRALGRLRQGEKRHTLLYVLAGLVVGAPVLALIVYLLMAADAVFSNLLGTLGDTLANLFQGRRLGHNLWVALRLFIVGLVCFSLLYALRHPRTRTAAPAETAAGKKLPAAPCIAFLGVLNAVYLLFCVVQFLYLFRSAVPPGDLTAAEYARSGFFQLVAVAGINGGLSLFFAQFFLSQGSRSRVERAIQILCWLLLALTVVILCSALWRMCRYIAAFGLSELRYFTLWAMGMIFLCLLAAAWKVARPGWRFFRVGFAVCLVLWLALNYTNVDARVANYNVDAYLSGALETVDVDYLSALSGDALPALERLLAAQPDYPQLQEEIQALRARCQDGAHHTWQAWNLSNHSAGSE